MDLAAIMLGATLAAAVILFIARPWWSAQKPALAASSPAQQNLTELEHQHDAVLSALRDLEFDRSVGRVAAKDYAVVRNDLLSEAATIVEQLDTASTTTNLDLDAQIEAEIAALRQISGPAAATSGATCPACRQTARPGDNFCRSCGNRLAQSCPDCGASVHAADHFCERCGAELLLAIAG